MIKLYKTLKKSFLNDEWDFQNRFEIIHKVSKEKLWVENGWMFFTGCESVIDIPFLFRLPLWIYYKKNKRRTAIKRIGANENEHI